MTPDPYPDLGADGEPAERPELSEADSRLLDALSHPEPPVVTPVEDEPPAVRAALREPGTPRPSPPGRGLLDPVFQEPGD